MYVASSVCEASPASPSRTPRTSIPPWYRARYKALTSSNFRRVAHSVNEGSQQWLPLVHFSDRPELSLSLQQPRKIHKVSQQKVLTTSREVDALGWQM